MALSTLWDWLQDNWGYKLLALLLSVMLYLFVRGDLREPSEEVGPAGPAAHGSH
jgi:YbbR domain-containing protein